MITDADVVDAGDMDDVARPGPMNRRAFMVGSAALGALGLAGCASTGGMSLAEAERVYGPIPDERFPIPAVKVSKINPKYLRRRVRYASTEAVGTIIVDLRKYYVYRIEGDGYATRYGANVSRAGFLWSGDAYIGRKAEWPVWTPPKEMIVRQPEVARYAAAWHRGLTTHSAHGRSSLPERRLHALHDLQHNHAAPPSRLYRFSERRRSGAQGGDEDHSRDEPVRGGESAGALLSLVGRRAAGEAGAGDPFWKLVKIRNQERCPSIPDNDVAGATAPRFRQEWHSSSRN